LGVFTVRVAAVVVASRRVRNTPILVLFCDKAVVKLRVSKWPGDGAERDAAIRAYLHSTVGVAARRRGREVAVCPRSPAIAGCVVIVGELFTVRVPRGGGCPG